MNQKNEISQSVRFSFLERFWEWMGDQIDNLLDPPEELMAEQTLAITDNNRLDDSHTDSVTCELGFQISTHARLMASTEFSQQLPRPVADEIIEKMRRADVMIPAGYEDTIRAGLMFLVGASLLPTAAAHHTMSANVTLLAPDSCLYLYSYDPTFAKLADVAQGFLDGTCGVTKTGLNPVQKLADAMVVLGGVPDGFWHIFKIFDRILPEHEIASLAIHHFPNMTHSQATQDCLVSSVQGAVSSINQSELALTLGIGIPAALFGLAVMGLGLYACVRCCCIKSQYAGVQGPQALNADPNEDTRLNVFGTSTLNSNHDLL